MQPNTHAQDVDTVLKSNNVSASTGLTQLEADKRLAEYGPNLLVEKGAKSPWRILWEQFTATMVLILVGAGALSVLLGKANESISIFAIVILFGLLGFFQEYRAERAMAALKRMSVPIVRARRDGAVRELAARDLVPGDIVLLEAGNVVPADLRLIDVANLRIQESALTGESEAVEKSTAALPAEISNLGDRRNQAFMGTVATYGRGAGIVIATGMRAELGRIASLIQNATDEATPLQTRLDRLGKGLAIAGAVIAALVLLIGVWRGETVQEMLLTAVSVAVAIIPEGLPAVVTFTLALGARRMLQRNALIRKLPAVETLGSVTVICSDKTGTLTENRMTVVVLDVAGHRVDIDETMRQDAPAYGPGDKSFAVEAEPLQLLLAGGALCNDALIEWDAATARTQTIGDPTEGALLVAAGRAGLARESLAQALPRVGELPFDSDRKRMTTVHAVVESAGLPDLARARVVDGAPAGHIAFTKGSVDGLLAISTRVWMNGAAAPMTADYIARIERANADLAANGMRVLGVAFRPLATLGAPTPAMESELIFVGFFGIVDPPRAEAREAVRVARQAGVRPVMITGDHPLTARYIAMDLGILARDATVGPMTGKELAALDEAGLAEAVERVSVYARVAPEQKLRIVEALQKRGHIVAMTGDGVNDAPALKQANIGVAMGITGTDVTKEAADMVLRDDNFATIVAAVEEGRAIYDNVRRFVKFSIGGNIGKVGVMLIAPLLGMPVALLPLQLLWLNLLTDGLLGLGMGFEPVERDAMRRPPISPKAGIFSGGLGLGAVWVGVLLTVLTLGIGFYYWANGRPEWQTMMFSVLAFAQVGQALAARSHRQSFFRIGLGGNKPLLVMILIVFIGQILALNLPFLEDFFKVQPLDVGDYALALLTGVIVFAAIEVEKAWLRRRS